MSSSDLHDHLWIDIFQHTQRSFFGCENKRVWKYRYPLLSHVIKHGSYRVFKTVLATGIDVNQMDEDGWTALMWAIDYDRDEVVNVLLASGADANACDIYGDTPLLLACYWGDSVEVVKMLLAAGADVNARNIDGKTPLSVSNGKIRKILLAAGAIE